MNNNLCIMSANESLREVRKRDDVDLKDLFKRFDFLQTHIGRTGDHAKFRARSA